MSIKYIFLSELRSISLLFIFIYQDIYPSLSIAYFPLGEVINKTVFFNKSNFKVLIVPDKNNVFF